MQEGKYFGVEVLRNCLHEQCDNLVANKPILSCCKVDIGSSGRCSIGDGDGYFWHDGGNDGTHTSGDAIGICHDGGDALKAKITMIAASAKVQGGYGKVIEPRGCRDLFCIFFVGEQYLSKLDDYSSQTARLGRRIRRNICNCPPCMRRILLGALREEQLLLTCRIWRNF